MIHMYYCFPFWEELTPWLIYIPCFHCITKVFVVSEFRSVTSWYQSFDLSELGIDCSIPRLKFSKVMDRSPTLGKDLGGESVKIYGNTLVGIIIVVTGILMYNYS